jgi:hypothetical protein
MIWWFLILGMSTLVVVCVAIALYMRLRRHLQAAHAARKQAPDSWTASVSQAIPRPDLLRVDSEAFPWKNQRCKL